MENKIDVGGYAFATPYSDNVAMTINHYADLRSFDAQTGMYLIDYFAAKAMQGLCAGDKSRAVQEPQALAAISYQIASKMIEERKKYMI